MNFFQSLLSLLSVIFFSPFFVHFFFYILYFWCAGSGRLSSLLLPQASVMTQRRHTNRGTCRVEKEMSGTGADERTDGQKGRTEDRTKNTQAVFVRVYLVSSGSKAQAELPADHHGFVDAPVLAAHGAPASGSAHVHQHLHATLAGLAASRQTHLEIRQMGVFLPRRSQQIQLSLKWNFLKRNVLAGF